MNQRNQDRFGSSSEGRDLDRDDRGQQSSGRGYSTSSSAGWREGSYRGGAMRGSGYGSGDRDWSNGGFARDDHGSDRDRGGERFGTQGYGMSNDGGSGYGSARGSSELDMRDYNDGRGRNLGSDDGRWQSPDSGSSDWRGARGQEHGDAYGGSRNTGDDRWNAPRGTSGQGEYRGSNDFRSQSYRGESHGAPRGSYGMREGMLGYGYGGGYASRQKGGSSGYADVSDYGRGGIGSGIDYGASYNRDNQDFSRGRGDDRSFGDRLEDWGHRAKEGIKDLFGGPKNYKRSDDRIREDVCDRLQQLGSRGHLDPSDIEVSVKDGEVTLTGTVPQRDWKHRAEDLAEAVSGVKEVDNRIRVQKQQSGGLSSNASDKSSTTTSASSSLTSSRNSSAASAKSSA